MASIGLEPLKPNGGGPDYDLAWRRDESLIVAEVKSMTATNQSKQLRLALGEVLDYADQLTRAGHAVRPVIAVELEPTDSRWVELCLSHGVTLVWPSRFEAL